MKKKNVSLHKKLVLGKSTVAALNVSQQQMIAGGVTTVTVTKLITCNSQGETCATAPVRTKPCELCNTL
ncbi:class I lanthipeptide [Chitinophaga flava]|uniref:Class I lanthipeptide n=1 Tax=Chitinophaga flava TaxID=2259036 RepID=A0A365XVW5_9BACT|nr:class I lanthipeptide [Chitinophaga flava]RBL90151.1 hypothetical protein DF182_27170 [Chitinophaga flava]